MEEAGATVETHVLARWSESVTARQEIEWFRARTHSNTWSLSEKAHAEVLRRFVPRVESLYRSLDVPEPVKWNLSPASRACRDSRRTLVAEPGNCVVVPSSGTFVAPCRTNWTWLRLCNWPRLWKRLTGEGVLVRARST